MMSSKELIKTIRVGAHGLDSTVLFLVLDVCDRLERQMRDNELLMQHIVELRSRGKWIPVTERLPDTQEYDWVLAQITLKPECIYGVPVVAELRADGWYDAYDNMIDGKYEKVTHWMPLPEPPKGE